MPETRMENENIVVIIPGSTSSVLQKDGKDIWAISEQTIWLAFNTPEDSLLQLKLKGNDDLEAEDLGDGIKATKLIEDAHLILGLVKIDSCTKRVFIE